MLSHKQNFRKPIRDGISIIEVLTSMAVATIGVFGVMILIPFAVKQSETGLVNDAGNALGRNAVEEMQINGLFRVDEVDNTHPYFTQYRTLDSVLPRLIYELPTTPGNFLQCNVDRPGAEFPVATPAFRLPGAIHFDPIGFSNGLTNLTIEDPAGNIQLLSATASRTSTISANLPAGGRISTIEASHLCRSKDQLFYETDQEGVEDIAPPQPIFDFNGVNAVKRQSAGRLSWSMFLVPEKSPSLTTSTINRFRSHAIVYRDRFIDPTTPENRVINRNLIPNPPELIESTYDYFLTDMEGGGFIPTVNQITFDGAITPDLTQTIFRDDWVMLVNRIPEPDPMLGGDTPLSVPQGGVRYRAADEGFRIQLMFARVTRVNANSIAVDGGAFDFVPANINSNPLGGIASSETYMVHLKNVVNVFERSVSVER
jgi:hypothetical protein